MPTFPFEVSLEEILRDPESYVDSVFSCLESEFLVMPKGAYGLLPASGAVASVCEERI